MGCALFWIFLAFTGAPTSYGLSQTVLDALTFYSGYWDNKLQIEQGGKEYDHIQCWITPVDVPALRPNPVVLIKELNNGVLGTFSLGQFFEGPDNNTVLMKIYNFKNFTENQTGTFDTEKLKMLKLEDLQWREDCFAEFAVVNRAFLSGNYDYCLFKKNGKYPRISVTSNCDDATVIFSQDTVQTSPLGPYVFHRTGQRYPIINQPKDYVSPCDKPQSTTQNG